MPFDGVSDSSLHFGCIKVIAQFLVKLTIGLCRRGVTAAEKILCASFGSDGDITTAHSQAGILIISFLKMHLHQTILSVELRVGMSSTRPAGGHSPVGVPFSARNSLSPTGGNHYLGKPHTSNEFIRFSSRSLYILVHGHFFI